MPHDERLQLHNDIVYLYHSYINSEVKTMTAEQFRERNINKEFEKIKLLISIKVNNYTNYTNYTLEYTFETDKQDTNELIKNKLKNDKFTIFGVKNKPNTILILW